MKTTLEIVDIIWTYIDATQLKDMITGKIYKHKRLTGSGMEDIVINALPTTNGAIQEGIVNVNIHVPDIKVGAPNVSDSQPDHVRLKTLAGKSVIVLNEVWSEDYTFNIQQQLLIEDKEADDHYINIRIEFFSINI